ncbi:MAG TPA: copper-binding protein [Burkholderiaceae bacterium]|nr:copper-binding protein [Burkholderiaceae bacterium]
MTRRSTALLVAMAMALPAAAWAQAGGHAGHAGHGAPASAAAGDFADGEVRKVDKAAGKLTLKHGEIPSLGMPPMAMVFSVKDKAWLDTLKAGDKVRFKAAVDNGQYVVTEIAPAK